MSKRVMAIAFTLALWFAEVQLSRSGEEKDRGNGETCRFRGETFSCSFSLACWLIGGRSEGGCESSFPFSSWLFACCVPPKALRDPPKIQRRRDSVNRLNGHNSLQVVCGRPAMMLQKRIIGGSEAYFGELPWQAHLRIAGYQCGGVLVSKFFVLTAAHCVHRAHLRDILIYLGEHDTQNTGLIPEPYPEEVHRVVQKIVHPNFQFRRSQPDRFDIALVKLARGVVFRENILPICLPKKGSSFKGRMGLVAGWGKTDTSYGKTGTNVLRKAVVPILSDDECLMWHRHKNIRVELHKEMFCAGHSDGHMDACLGDSGGPLIVQENGRWVLAGITSAGFGCAIDHQPGIYHKVEYTAEWVTKIIHPP
ncbi:trypsin-1-like isoform X2 [Cimex lectularius]|nr:trypsin-1-like isoform X2 [Cimex lectularius]XP_014252558.1 trypsin-1-like isoform X2 [Cimex lectularius]